MSKPIYKARIKATDTVIIVYRHSERAGYIDAINCTDEYPEDKIEILEEHIREKLQKKA